MDPLNSRGRELLLHELVSTFLYFISVRLSVSIFLFPRGALIQPLVNPD